MQRYAIRAVGGVGWIVIVWVGWTIVRNIVAALGIHTFGLDWLIGTDWVVILIGSMWGWMWILREPLKLDRRRHLSVGAVLAVSVVIPGLAFNLAEQYVDWIDMGTSPGPDLRFYLLRGFVLLSALAPGLACLAIAAKLARLSPARPHVALVPCPGCGYDMRGLREARCPECGTEYTLDQLVAGIGETRSNAGGVPDAG